ncbi:glutamate racemase [Paenibacillus sp. TRM 82003]|nr:glutamate racemase [Paenibacillus sp. TRM 82003]
MTKAIAILDSGVGGLTVAREVMRQLPQEKILYFGDTARAPYGPRPSDEVALFTNQIVDYLLQFDPKMLVIACNTATAVAIDHIRSRVHIPVLGVITPGARAAIKQTSCGSIGVIGTEGTIRSRAYETALRRISPDIKVVSLACPSFVPLVEQGLFRSDSVKETVCEALKPLQREAIDTLILGCTHYPFLARAIGECMGSKVTLISSADQTARDISTVLYHNGQLASSKGVPVHRFFCSGSPGTFQRIAQDWLNEEIQVTPVIWQVPRFI